MTTSPTKKTLALAYSLIAAAIVLGIVVMQVKAANKPAEELLVLDAVVAYVGRCSPYVLRDITHSEKPWSQARGSLPKDSPSNAKIDDEDIRRFFDDIRREYDMDKPAEISRYMETAVASLPV